MTDVDPWSWPGVISNSTLETVCPTSNLWCSATRYSTSTQMEIAILTILTLLLPAMATKFVQCVGKLKRIVYSSWRTCTTTVRDQTRSKLLALCTKLLSIYMNESPSFVSRIPLFRKSIGFILRRLGIHVVEARTASSLPVVKWEDYSAL